MHITIFFKAIGKALGDICKIMINSVVTPVVAGFSAKFVAAQLASLQKSTVAVFVTIGGYTHIVAKMLQPSLLKLGVAIFLLGYSVEATASNHWNNPDPKIAEQECIGFQQDFQNAVSYWEFLKKWKNAPEEYRSPIILNYPYWKQVTFLDIVREYDNSPWKSQTERYFDTFRGNTKWLNIGVIAREVELARKRVVSREALAKGCK